MSNAAQFSPNTLHLLTATVPEPTFNDEVSYAVLLEMIDRLEATLDS